MPERSPLQQTDLTTAVPSGVKLTGLSEPRFDGVNFYRTPTASRSAIDFVTRGQQFVQMEYQLHSPSEEVTGVLKLDGHILDHTTFPAGQFISNVVAGAFVSAGAHRFTLDYRCRPQPCAAPLSQYWTRLAQKPSTGVVGRQDAGLGVERWWLNAPGSPLKITGAGPLSFDGVNFVRRLSEPSVQLSWPSGQALNASLLLNASQPFRVTTRAGSQVLSVQSGDKTHSVWSTVSLVGHGTVGSLTVQVDCLKGPPVEKGGAGPGCAFLYFPQVAVLTAPPTSAVQTGGAALAALLVLTGLWHWLRLPAGAGAAPG